VVVNPDSGTGTLNNGFTVTAENPVVTAVTPDNGANDGTQSVQISGSYFQNGAVVKLTKTSQADIDASSVIINNHTKYQLPVQPYRRANRYMECNCYKS